MEKRILAWSPEASPAGVEANQGLYIAPSHATVELDKEFENFECGVQMQRRLKKHDEAQLVEVREA